MGLSIDRDKVIEILESCVANPLHRKDDKFVISFDVRFANAIIELLKEQEPIKPTINEDGEAFCVCGENVGFIPSSKDLPKICSKYCPECGRRMEWG